MIKLTLLFFVAAVNLNIAHADFAYGTKIKRADGSMRKIEEIAVGDQITSLAENSKMGDIETDKSKIQFSMGSRSGRMMLVYLEFANNNKLLVTMDQIFPLADGTFKKALELWPNHDELISEDGKPIEIKGSSFGPFDGGLHNIASDSNMNLSNLFIAEGIWVGSYKSQIYYGYGKFENYNVFENFDVSKP